MTTKPLIIANWKATKSVGETKEWLEKAKEGLTKIDFAEIIVCPPFTSLSLAAEQFKDTPVRVGAQDVSRFSKGSYTGEVTVEMLSGLVSHCIVGHSERRRFFGETDDHVIEKVNRLLENQITPILCVSDLSQMQSYLDRGKTIIEKAEKIVFVYEPPGAISGGKDYKPEDPVTAGESAKKIGEALKQEVITLYGGSVNPGNVAAFLSQDNIQGGLLGQASTSPETFLEVFEAIKTSVIN